MDKALASLPFGRILVTGARGFVGRRLVERLVSVAPQAHILCATRALDGLVGPESILMDLQDPASVRSALSSSRPDLVIHLAGQSSVGAGTGPSGAATTWSVNTGGAISLGSALAAEAPDATVLYASSAEVYGAAFNNGPVDETTVPQPLSAYSRSKFAAEQILSDFMAPQARLIIARPGNHSGAGQDERFVLPSFASQMAKSEIFVGNLGAERDFLHVDDVIDAYMALLQAASSLPPRNLFNISMGKPVSVGELLDKMLALSGSKAAILVDPTRLRPNEIPCVWLRSDRIRQALDWKPQRSVEDMLRDLVGYYGAAPSV